jgi:hypothetical protein
MTYTEGQKVWNFVFPVKSIGKLDELILEENTLQMDIQHSDQLALDIFTTRKDALNALAKRLKELLDEDL